MTPALQTADWIVIIIFITLTFCIGLYFAKRAGKHIESFFVSGRSLPWYIAGISFVAAGFASDTPICSNAEIAGRKKQSCMVRHVGPVLS